MEETRRIEEQIDGMKSRLMEVSRLNEQYNFLEPGDVA
jgi:hypothetical protein